MRRNAFRLLPALVLCAGLHQAFAQGTAFTYQGRLNDGGNAVNGSYDLTFTLYTASSGGSAFTAPLTTNAVGLTNGLFTVTLDFGSGVFDGNSRWLEIGVRTNGSGSFATLSPRQQLMPTPYAIFANTASQLTGNALQQVQNVANSIVGTATNGFVGIASNMVQTATNNLLGTITNIAQSLGGNATNAINNNNGVGTNITVYGTLTSTNLNAEIQSATNNALATATNSFYGIGNPSNYVTVSVTNGLATTAYVTAVTNGGNILFTNQLPGLTNGFVTSTITNGLATTAYVTAVTNGGNILFTNQLPGLTNGFVTSTITNGLASTNYVSTITNGLATTAYAVAITNGGNIVFTNNTTWFDTKGAATAVTNGGNILFTNQLPGLTNGFVTSTITNGLASTNYVSTITNGLATTAYAIAITNGGNILFTNQLPGLTNGFVTSTITNGLATTAYVTAVTNGGNILFTNQLPGLTNGFVTSTITNGLASTNYVSTITNGLATTAYVVAVTNAGNILFTNQLPGLTNGFVTSTITNGLASTNYVSTITNGLATTAYVVAVTNGGNILFTNQLPGLTNGFVTSTITNGLATTAYAIAITNGGNIVFTNNTTWFDTKGAATAVTNGGNILFTNQLPGLTNGFVTSTITNGLASTNYVSTITNGLATTAYVTAVTNGGNILFTNQLPGLTNGFVTSTITNGLATTAYVVAVTNAGNILFTNQLPGLTNGFVTSTITNGLASTNYVSTITNGLATTNYVNTATNNLLVVATNAANLIGVLPQYPTVQIATNIPFTNAVLISPDGTNRMWSAATNLFDVTGAAAAAASSALVVATNAFYGIGNPSGYQTTAQVSNTVRTATNGVMASVTNVTIHYTTAKGDGVTDDTTALQNDINTLETGTGGVLFLRPNATYKVTGTILITNSNIQIWGQGPSTRILSYGASSGYTGGHVILADPPVHAAPGLQGISFRDFTIDANDSRTSGAMICVKYSSQTFIKNVIVGNYLSPHSSVNIFKIYDGIRVEAQDSMRIEGTQVYPTHWGIYVSGDSKNTGGTLTYFNFDGYIGNYTQIMGYQNGLPDSVGIYLDNSSATPSNLLLGFGGLMIDQTSISSFATGIYVANANRELFIGRAFLDSCTNGFYNAGSLWILQVNDGWGCGCNQDGYYIGSVGNHVSFTGGTFYSNGGAGIRKTDEYPLSVVGAVMHDNGEGDVVGSEATDEIMTQSLTQGYLNATIAGGQQVMSFDRTDNQPTSLLQSYAGATYWQINADLDNNKFREDLNQWSVRIGDDGASDNFMIQRNDFSGTKPLFLVNSNGVLSGNGAGFTNLPAANLVGTLTNTTTGNASYATNAGNATTATTASGGWPTQWAVAAITNANWATNSANLTALAGLDATTGFVKQTGANTFTKAVSGTDYGIPIDVQVFTSTGTNLWTKPAGAKAVKVILWGGGGQGGGGAGGASGTPRSGGGGGAYNERFFNAADLGNTENVVVGAGGTTGGQAGTSAVGTVGASGGTTSFGTSAYFSAYGGGGGYGGLITQSSTPSTYGGGGGGGRAAAGAAGTSTAGGVGGAPAGSGTAAVGGGGGGGGTGNVGICAEYGGAGGGGSSHNTNSTFGTSFAGGSSLFGGPGGGSGGGVWTNDTAAAGSAGGTYNSYTAGGGAAKNTAGTAGNSAKAGTAGGGGDSNASSTGTAGGAGAHPGSGGGGGGGGTTTGGVGGNGGDGYAVVISW